MGFCREHRGEYEAVPNERALWLRISNMIEAEDQPARHARDVPSGAGWWFRLMNRSWQLSFPKLAAAVAVMVVGRRRWLPVLACGNLMAERSACARQARTWAVSHAAYPIDDRYRQQQQAIAYWNQRVEIE